MTHTSIDEKWLDNFQKEQYSEEGVCWTDEEMEEIIRLARLGLWASTHGIPAITKLSESHDDSGLGACAAAFTSNAECTCHAATAHSAKLALPKET